MRAGRGMCVCVCFLRAQISDYIQKMSNADRFIDFDSKPAACHTGDSSM